jgi:hypothetical protein
MNDQQWKKELEAIERLRAQPSPDAEAELADRLYELAHYYRQRALDRLLKRAVS